MQLVDMTSLMNNHADLQGIFWKFLIEIFANNNEHVSGKLFLSVFYLVLCHTVQAGLLSIFFWSSFNFRPRFLHTALPWESTGLIFSSPKNGHE